MIFDTLEHLQQYCGISKNLDRAITFLESARLEELPLGKVEICAEQVYLTVMEVQTVPAQGLKLETHNRYLDIHIDIQGDECVRIAPRAGLVEDAPYLPEKDLTLYITNQQTDTIPVLLGEGRFIICWPQDAHMPNTQGPGGAGTVRKCVVKVAVD